MSSHRVSIPLYTRLLPPIVVALRRRAEQERRSVAAMIAILVEDGLNVRRPTGEPLTLPTKKTGKG